METILSIRNPFTKEQLEEGYARWPKTLSQAKERSQFFQAIKKKGVCPETLKHLETVGACQKTLEPLLREATDVEKEGYSQVIFTGSPWSGLNTIPFALLFLSLYKSYIVPAFGILLPLLSWILPYVMIKAFYNIPITFGEYVAILWRVWNGQPLPRSPQEILNPPPAPQQDMMTRLRTLTQNAWTLFTVGQALWQPIQQAKHFQTLDKDCSKLGTAVVSLKESASWVLEEWKNFLPKGFDFLVGLCPSEAKQAFAFVFDTPYWLRHVFRGLGRFEVLVKLAAREDTVPVEFLNAKQPTLLLKDFGDPAIEPERRVVSSVSLGGGRQSHVILTGPNRGGKSSFLRGIYETIRLAHAFGAAFAGKAQMTRFDWIANGLGLEDLPGDQSMFEREVRFASGVVQKQDGLGLVLYDELFHSTNPPDAKRASELFCDRLWKKDNAISILSTHVYSLAEGCPKERVKAMCMATWKSAEGDYTFSYSLQRGICKVSSVDLLLKTYRLL